MPRCFCIPRPIAGRGITATTPEAGTALTQITPRTSGTQPRLGLSDGAAREIKSSPLLVDGMLYLTVPDNVWAVDARTGHALWHYTYPPNKGDHIGQRGVGMYKDWIFFTSPDAHLVSPQRQGWQGALDHADGGCRQGLLGNRWLR